MTSLLLSKEKTGFCYIHKPVVNMRELPNHESKVVSQAFFSEKISLEKESNGWLFIKTSDEYTGWIHSDACINLTDPYEGSIKTTRLFSHIYEINDIEYGPIATLPYESRLKLLEETDSRWVKVELLNSRDAYIQKGDITEEPIISHWQDLVEFSKKFIGLPYTWGGRTSFGYDCSGFVQMLYGKIKIQLPRDSKQQIQDKRFRIISIKELSEGNLLFFGKSEQQIMHVGMYVGNGQFIHASSRENKPWVRISSLQDPEWAGMKEVYYPYRIGASFLYNNLKQEVYRSCEPWFLNRQKNP